MMTGETAQKLGLTAVAAVSLDQYWMHVALPFHSKPDAE